MKCSVIQQTQQSQIVGGSPQPELISVRRFRADLGIVPSTLWRWVQRGWLDQPIDIGGRKYLTADMVWRFKDRAARGEFAGKTKPPRSKLLATGDSDIHSKMPMACTDGGEGVGVDGEAMPSRSIPSENF
jgi:hypothetical protein